MNAIYVALLNSAIRHVGSIVGSALVSSGLFTQDESSTLVGAAAILGSVGWSLVDSWLKTKKIKLLGK